MSTPTEGVDAPQAYWSFHWVVLNDRIISVRATQRDGRNVTTSVILLHICEPRLNSPLECWFLMHYRSSFDKMSQWSESSFMTLLATSMTCESVGALDPLIAPTNSWGSGKSRIIVGEDFISWWLSVLFISEHCGSLASWLITHSLNTDSIFDAAHHQYSHVPLPTTSLKTRVCRIPAKSSILVSYSDLSYNSHTFVKISLEAV